MDNKKSKTALMGGELMKVKLTTGKTREVTIRQPKIRELERYQAALEDDIQLLKFITHMSDVEIDELTPDAYMAILEKEGAVNGPLARFAEERTMKRAAANLEQLKTAMPKIYDDATRAIQAKAVEAMAGGKVSLSPSPTAAPPQG